MKENLRNNDEESSSQSKVSYSSTVIKSSAKAELNLLSELLGLEDRSSDKEDNKHFKINLFPVSTFEMKDSNDDEYSTIEESKAESNFIIFDIDGTADAKSISKYMDDLGLNDSKSTNVAGSKATDYNDLLDLMDSAK
eukprot:gene18735-24499_t